MKLFIDTINTDFFISLIKDNKTIAFIHKEKLIKKSDFLPKAFSELMANADKDIKDIDSIYVTDGPGSFMGIRAGLTFAKVICHVQKKSLFVANNFIFISGGQEGTYYVDAKSNQSFRGLVKKSNVEVKLVDATEDSNIDYKAFIANPETTLKHFKEVSDITNYEPQYFKDPQIGGA